MVKSNANYPLLGQILDRRYQILQVLSSGAFGQTYAARDLQQPHQPECAIKHYPLDRDYPSLAIACQRLFRAETDSLKKLGVHSQIPQFLDSFEEEQDFYLVQELIVGPTLSEHLFTLKQRDLGEREAEAIALLQDILPVLDFIHSQGTIHCDLKPNNLMRRAEDGKWVVIDFGTAQSIYLYPNEDCSGLSLNAKGAASPSGYLAPEQGVGKSYPNSDIYALGIVALETLTGIDPLNPKDLQRHPKTGDLIWPLDRCATPSARYEVLQEIIQKMTCRDAQKRYQSAAEVLAALSPQSSPLQLSPPEEDAIARETVEEIVSSTLEPETGDRAEQTLTIPPPRSRRKQLAPLVGLWAVLAVLNTLSIAFGWQTLSDPAMADPGASLLSQASQTYHSGDLDKAIALAQSIPPDSLSYNQSQKTVKQWRRNWQRAETQFQQVEQSFQRKQWTAVLSQARRMPKIGFWQQRLKPLVGEAQLKAEDQAQHYFNKALVKARYKEFTQALSYLEKISPYTQVGKKIQPKLLEYRYKQRIRARAVLQKAYDLAAVRDFSGAIYYLEQVPSHTPAGAIAQQKKIEYAQKQRIKEQVETAARSKVDELSPLLASPDSPTELNPGDRLQEINSLN